MVYSVYQQRTEYWKISFFNFITSHNDGSALFPVLVDVTTECKIANLVDRR